MNELLYYKLTDKLMMSIEDAIGASGMDIDIDCVNAGGILTLTPDGCLPVIISRQPSLRQLWVAATCGGFHFTYDEEKKQWTSDAVGETFIDLVNRCLSEQSGEQVRLDF